MAAIVLRILDINPPVLCAPVVLLSALEIKRRHCLLCAAAGKYTFGIFRRTLLVAVWINFRVRRQ